MAEEPGMGEGGARVQPNSFVVHLASQAELRMQKLWIGKELGGLVGQKECPKKVLSKSWGVGYLQRPCRRG